MMPTFDITDVPPRLSPVDFLKLIRLRQYPARRRMMLFKPWYRESTKAARIWDPVLPLMMDVPCFSFGEAAKRKRSFSGPRPWFDRPMFFVFRHRRPWKDLGEAAKEGFLHTLPFCHYHEHAAVCLGNAEAKIVQGKLSVEEAFWSTVNSVYKSQLYEQSKVWNHFNYSTMVNIDHISQENWTEFHVEGNDGQIKDRGSD